MSNNPIGIIGTDGYTPLYEPQASWKMWSIHEIYRGFEGQNKFIPKVNDYVIEPETFTVYRVESLDPITFIPNLVLIKPFGSNFVYSETDVLLGPSNENFRAYVDKSVTPYTLSIDDALHIYGSEAQAVRIYRGTIIDPHYVASMVYDNNGNFIGNDVGLELVLFNSHDNFAVKVVKTCNTNMDLQDGEILTVVVLGSNGRVLSKRGVIVENTTFVARAYNDQKYITNVFLKTPFISTVDPNVINYPVNLPIASFNPIGVVQYNDGSQVEWPIDGTKFEIEGLTPFISTIIGHKVPLVLRYKLAPNEATIAGLTSDYVYITKPYELVVSNPNSSYDAQLQVYPVWNNSTGSYALRAYLTNLDRNIHFDVTPFLTIATNSPAFNPTLYGVTQRITFRVNLQDVSSLFSFFIYTQVCDIVLRAPATDTSHPTPWEVGVRVPSTIPNYGENAKAVRNTTHPKKLRLHGGSLDLNAWLNYIYTRSQPLLNPTTEVVPITPTHMKVIYNSEEVVVPVSQYNTDITFTNNINLYDPVTVIFMKQIATGYLILSVAVLTIR
jgi:hypothetical protein